jgi:hypothetical protein
LEAKSRRLPRCPLPSQRRRHRPPDPQARRHWAFHYDIDGDEDDEVGFRFDDEKFVIGEYVSIREDETMHTFRVTSVEPV